MKAPETRSNVKNALQELWAHSAAPDPLPMVPEDDEVDAVDAVDGVVVGVDDAVPLLFTSFPKIAGRLIPPTCTPGD